jgi:hypothetical protein
MELCAAKSWHDYVSFTYCPFSYIAIRRNQLCLLPSQENDNYPSPMYCSRIRNLRNQSITLTLSNSENCLRQTSAKCAYTKIDNGYRLSTVRAHASVLANRSPTPGSLILAFYTCRNPIKPSIEPLYAESVRTTS